MAATNAERRSRVADDYLEDNVWPLLRQAKAEFENDDLAVRITSGLHLPATLSFEVYDPADDGARQKSRVVGFQHDGASFSFSTAWSDHASPVIGHAPDLVVGGMEIALDHFFRG